MILSLDKFGESSAFSKSISHLFALCRALPWNRLASFVTETLSGCLADQDPFAKPLSPCTTDKSLPSQGPLCPVK